MRKTISILLTVVLTSLLLGGGVFANEESEFIEYYQYPLTLASEDWFDYTVQEKVDALIIPDEILKKMSDSALIQAIADYPYLIDMYVCDTIEEGLDALKITCSAYNELMARNTAKDMLLSRGTSVLSESRQAKNERSSFIEIAMTEIITSLSDDVPTQNNSISSSGIVPYRASVTTPNGSIVNAYYDQNEINDLDTRIKLDDEVVRTYGVTFISRGTNKYNCHSYAWYSQSTSNKYWIDYPTAYMTDGSYTKVASGIGSTTNHFKIAVNDRVYYQGTHTALFKGNPSSGVPLATQPCYSKWGRLGVFQHSMANVPASYGTNITVWHR